MEPINEDKVRAHFATQTDTTLGEYVARIYHDMLHHPEHPTIMLFWGLLFDEIRQRPTLGDAFATKLLSMLDTHPLTRKH